MCLAQRRIAPVADRVEAPRLQAVDGARAPCRQPVFAIDAVEIRRVEIEPAPVVVTDALTGVLIRTTAVAAAVERRPLAAHRWQILEHELAAFDIGAATIRRHDVHTQRKKRMAVRRHQPPATGRFLRVKPAGLLQRDVQTSTVGIGALSLRSVCGEGGALLRMCLTQGCIGADLLRPMAARELPMAVDDARIGIVQRGVAGHTFDASEQQRLRRTGCRHAKPDRADLVQIEHTLHRGRQQRKLAMMIVNLIIKRHRRPRLHALAARRFRMQRNHQCLRWSRRQSDRGVQMATAGIVKIDTERDRPCHRVLHLNAQFAARGPVPRTPCGRNDQLRLRSRLEGIASQRSDALHRLACRSRLHVTGLKMDGG